jgi:hypothetical protein
VAIKASIVIQQGSDFQTTINFTDDNDDVVDLTGYSGSAQLRKHYTSSTSYPFVVTVSPSLGTVTLAMNYANTSNIPAGRYVFDCELTDTVSNTISRVVEGVATVTPQVTR